VEFHDLQVELLELAYFEAGYQAKAKTILVMVTQNLLPI
jgi:hypothetical protein